MGSDNKIPVLIVDNDAALRDLLTHILTEEGYTVEAAVHGIDALKKLDKFHPRLIILDLALPAMDGWEFLKVYHEMPGLTAPVLAVPAHPVKDMPQGISGFLPKPFDIMELLRRVQALTSARTA